MPAVMSAFFRARPTNTRGILHCEFMPTVTDLEPKSVWKHFAALSAIPRPSRKEAAARAYVLSEAARLNLQATQDAAGNVVVRKPATPGREKAPMAALQGHLDMVCEQNEGGTHNFDTDPIRLVPHGDWLMADGTTLGSDNGLGVAAALAVMESSSIKHGPLEFVFTIDEETGLTGANEFPEGVLHSKYFLNLDGEEEGTLCIGCAGGINTVARRKIARHAAGAGQGYRIKVAGLAGGHSGVDIHKGRGNALRFLAYALQGAIEKFHIEVADVKGGSAHNAIPREAYATIVLDPSREADLRALLAKIESAGLADLGSYDPGLKITLEPVAKPAQVLAAADAAAIAAVLIALPHGVMAMSPDVPGLVQNSTNIAMIATREDHVEIETSQRSAIETSKNGVARMVSTVFRLAGFDPTPVGGYPGWKPEPGSDIVKAAKAAHQEILGKTPELVAMHAGLECGVIGEKHPGMQMISFGPQIENPHSPGERLKISSVEPFWKFLTGLLERI
jgi:dipeptidase D